MIQCVVIADDLTGANATGVMLKKRNLRTISLMNLDRVDFKSLSNYDAITYPTESRSIDKELAYNRVHNIAMLVKSPDIQLYSKRIDSTLRGNLGSEIDAILDGLGDNRVALVVPAFPQAGRIAVGGYLLVNGVMLQKTDAARDPKNPIHTSVIEDLVRVQTRYPVKSIFLDTVYEGVDTLAKAIKRCASEGNRVLVIDALQIEDLDTIADAVIESGIGFVTVDPGPFTAAVAGKLIAIEQNRMEEKILLAVGSVSNLTKIQLEEVQRAFSLLRVEILSHRLIDPSQRDQEIQRVVDEVIKMKDDYVLACVVTNSIHPENRIDFKEASLSLKVSEEELSLRLNNGIAEITHRIISQAPEFKGIFSSGGDITVAVCKRLKASGMALKQEVIPLAAYGTLEGGDFPGLKIITKGGMVGDKDGMRKCVQFLKEQLSVE